MSKIETFKNKLYKMGYKCIEFKKEEYPVWSLWDSSDVFYVKKIMYKNVVNDYIYFIGSNYRNKSDKVCKYIDSVLEIRVDNEEIQIVEDIELAKILQGKIDSGYIPVGRDLLGQFIGAETIYYFEDDGELVETFECDDVVDFLNEKYKLL